MHKTSGLVPCLAVDGGQKAIAFFKAAFGAEEIRVSLAEDGARVMYAHLRVNDADLFLWDFFPEYGQPVEKPAAVVVHVEVADADALWQRALAAGASVVIPLEMQFWGQRYGQIADPFGHRWSIGEPMRPAG